jgi:hypothetical protein
LRLVHPFINGIVGIDIVVNGTLGWLVFPSLREAASCFSEPHMSGPGARGSLRWDSVYTSPSPLGFAIVTRRGRHPLHVDLSRLNVER